MALPLGLTIRANIIDINVDRPKVGESFYVDTNVWFWMTYTKVSQHGIGLPYQVGSYPGYTNQALSINCPVYSAGFNLAELMHVIEKSEHKISQKLGGTPKMKDFRHGNPAARLSVEREIDAACKQVMSLSTLMDVDLNSNFVSDSVSNFGSFQVDGYDLMTLEALNKYGVNNIITDDCDFATAANMNIFTANQNLIQAATVQGKLLIR